MNKSIIISYRESSEERRYNLKCLLEYLATFQDGRTEIIIVEQDDTKKLDWLKPIKGSDFFNHVFIENDGIFNKGWGYNVGAKMAKGEALMFSDCDIFIKPQTYNIALQLLKSNDVINPYKSVVFLDEQGNEFFKSHNYSFSVANKYKPEQHNIITGGVFFMKKDKYLELKGFDEDCYGWGHEDDILDEKIRKLDLKVNTLNDICIHMYHKPSSNNNDLYYSFIDVNKELFENYKKMSKNEILHKIETTVFWGDVSESTVKDTSTRHIKRQLYTEVTEKVLDHTLSKFTDQYLDEIVNDISAKIYNTIVESITEKVKYQLNDINYSPVEKENMVKKILRKFKL